MDQLNVQATVEKEKLYTLINIIYIESEDYCYFL